MLIMEYSLDYICLYSNAVMMYKFLYFLIEEEDHKGKSAYGPQKS